MFFFRRNQADAACGSAGTGGFSAITETSFADTSGVALEGVSLAGEVDLTFSLPDLGSLPSLASVAAGFGGGGIM